jgi:hypothetical protein
MRRHHAPLLLLVLLGALAVAQVAAASPSRPTSTFAHPTVRDDAAEVEAEEEFEAEEEEFEFEDCESAAEELEFDEGAGEFEEEELEADCGAEGEAVKATPKGAPFVTAPAACLVRQAESTITALPGSDRVRLSVRYRTYAPTQVTVGLKLKDHKGSVGIGQTTKHLGAKGVLHLTTELGAAMMERAMTASEFDVSLRAPRTPGFCAGSLEQRLHSVKHTGAKAPRVYAD